MFQTGTRIGPYEIQSQLGEGGMGVVYRAHDTKLKRDVAIKTLPGPLSSDAERLTRFQREAQALALLNHPNIAQIYGFEESGAGAQCIVMELVAGETLHEQLKRGPLPLEDSVEIAIQIAEGLEAAHERGIIHRDLKPANIKRTPDGKVKILDFGLARIFDDKASNSDFSNSPTMMSATGAGVLLGTAAYMSPEQARGRETGTRADIWAFGAVLYELLTGRQAFSGDTVTDVLATVLKSEPDWNALPPSTPQPIRSLLRRCLEKESRRRLQHIGDARIVLEDVLSGRITEASPSPAGPQPTAARSRERYVWIAITVLMLAGLVALLFRPSETQPSDIPAAHFAVFPPSEGDFTGRSAISPDGSKLAFLASDATGRSMVWIRPLDSLVSQPVPRTEGVGAIMFWLQDSRSLAFSNPPNLKRIELPGGTARDLGNVVGLASGSGNRDRVLLLGNGRGGIQRLSPDGGPASEATVLDQSRGENAHLEPMFLPDGEHFVYMTVPTGDLMLGSLGSKKSEVLLSGGVTSVTGYSSPGYVLFSRGTTVFALPFDPSSLRATGQPIEVLQNAVTVSVSENGVLSYRTPDSGLVKLTWFDRTGKVVSVEPVTGAIQAPNLSRDGKRVALEINSRDRQGIWILDLSRGTNMRVNSNGNRPFLSPDGSKIVFGQDNAIYMKSADGTGNEERLEAGEPTDWSPDGRHILFINGGELLALSLEDRKFVPIVTTPGNDRRGRFSPDGQWLAYESNESGRFEIYVQKFPSGPRVQVSANGGNSAWWRNDGKELFFNSPDRKLMSVDVRLGNTFDAGPPRVLFQVPGTINNGRFISTLDGQRFLVPLRPQEEIQPITIILNWPAMLKR